jgi:ribosomal protein L40E
MVVYCPKCGTKNSSNAQFCTKCGSVIAPVKKDNIKEGVEKDLKNKKQYINEGQQIEDYIGLNEHVIIKYNSYYATNKRLIFYKEGLFGKKLLDMAYNHISSLQLKNKPHTGMVVFGIVLLLVGVGLYQIPIIVFGLLISIIGFIWRTGFYELHASGGEKWKIPMSKSGVADQFIKVIRQQLTEG